MLLCKVGCIISTKYLDVPYGAVPIVILWFSSGSFFPAYELLNPHKVLVVLHPMDKLCNMSYYQTFLLFLIWLVLSETYSIGLLLDHNLL